MFPVVSRGRTLGWGLLAALVSVPACASTGPGTPPLAPMSSSVRGLVPEARVDIPRHQLSRPAPKRPRPAPVRRARADSAALEREVTRRLAHRPLAMALSRRVKNPEFADRVASAIVHEAGRARLSPSLLAGVLLIENAPFDTSAVSIEGAIGLMQVMPVHVGSYRCLSGDLMNVEANICHGARLLSSYVRRGKSIEAGLRRYNGCVRGRNTPRCHRYPVRVLRTAARIRREMLISADRLTPSSEGPRLSSAALGADLPVDLESADSSSDTGEQAQCSTLLGCLKRRWSSVR